MPFISILGDSISTFEGFNPDNSAVFYRQDTISKTGMNSVLDTWWVKTVKYLNGKVCVNSSFSDSRVTGESYPSACSTKRIQSLASDRHEPDIILIYIGFNDFGSGMHLRRAHFFRKDLDTFSDAYEEMLKKIRKMYPKADVICGTLMTTCRKNDPDWVFPDEYGGIPLNSYNNIIREKAEKMKVKLADLAESGLSYDSLDGTNPTAEGHKNLANVWIQCLKTLGY